MSPQKARRRADADLEPVVPGFTVLGRIGRGASATVWSARDLDSGTVYALKVATAPHGERASSAAHTEAREISLLRRLDHPHLVRLHRVMDLTDGRRVLVLDLAEIGSLADLLADRGPLREGEACWLLAPVAQAVAHLHARGVVHGDVSTANILVGAGGRPMLGDLGAARLLPRGAPSAGSSPGPGDGAPARTQETPGFGAPELARGQAPTPSSDIWSFGAVLKACLGDDAGSLARLVTACAARDPAGRPTAELVERVLRLSVAPARPDPAPVAPVDRAVTRPVAVVPTTGTATEPQVGPPAEPQALQGAGPGTGRRTGRGHETASGLRRQAGRVLRPLAGRVSRVGRGVEARARLRLAAAGLLVVAVTAGSVWWLAGVGPAGARAAPSAPPGDGTADPVRAVPGLAAARADLLNSGSAARLDELDVRGSPAWRDDVRLLASLSRRGIRLHGLRFAVTSARLVRWQDDAAVVRTELQVGAYERRRVGRPVERVPAAPAPVVDLVLERTPGGDWRVRETALPSGVRGAKSRRAD